MQVEELVYTGNPFHTHDETVALIAIAFGLIVIGFFLLLENGAEQEGLNRDLAKYRNKDGKR